MSQETIRDLGSNALGSWRWRPVWHQDREADQLLRRQLRLTDEERSAIRDDAVELLARCRPPDAEDGHDTGLVLGYVQSGKTLSFTTVAALAADNRFAITIVLSGVTQVLTDQTVSRLRNDLYLSSPMRPWSLLQVRPQDSGLMSQISHLVQQWSAPELPGFPRRAGLVVSLKNASRLHSLTQALSAVDLRGKPCLIIDDEADQSGLNTRVRQGDVSPVYEAILRLRAAVPHHTYLQYTATPQANVLLTVLDSLHPSFGWVLRPGRGYTGGQAFFGGQRNLLRTIPDNELPGHEDPEDPPNSLLFAMRLFFIGAATQAWRRHRQLPTQGVRSMLVHPSQRQRDHLKHKRWVDSIKLRWQTLLDAENGDTEDQAEELVDFRVAYDDLAATARTLGCIEQLPTFDELVPLLPAAMRETLDAWEVNSRQTEARWEPTNWTQRFSHILVGGENLSRGFTVEGLTVTYMPRPAGQRLADTIEQRARFFGYKASYLGLCRVFLPAAVQEVLTEYVEHEEFLREKLLELATSPTASMTQWRRAMLLTTSLKPTRPAVVPPNVYDQYRVEEWTVARSPRELDCAEAPVTSNRQTVDAFLASLTLRDATEFQHHTTEQLHGVSGDVRLQDLLDELLVPFEHGTRDAPLFTGVELVVQHWLHSHPDETATLCVMSHRAENRAGGGTRERTLTRQGDLQPFQGADPADGSRYPGDARIHDQEHVTIQIHNIDIYRRAESRSLRRADLACGNVPVLAVWIPERLRMGVLVER